jgi:hypothetical protein
MELKTLVDTYGADRVADVLGVTTAYIKRCLAPNATSRVRTVKLVNAAKKLK